MCNHGGIGEHGLGLHQRIHHQGSRCLGQLSSWMLLHEWQRRRGLGRGGHLVADRWPNLD